MKPIIWTTKTKRLGDLSRWDRNPRYLDDETRSRLEESIKEFGYSQLYEIEPDGTIIDGHQRDEVMLRMSKYGPGYEIEVREASRPLTLQERKKYIALKHEGAVGDWDWSAVEDLYTPEELQQWGFDELDLDYDLEDLSAGGDPKDEVELEEPDYNAIPNGDNIYDIPDLRLDLQLESVTEVTKWGTISRSEHADYWHFYTDDYKFQNVWAYPDQVVNTKPLGVFEVNFTTFERDRMIYVLVDIFKKRWLSRYWQEQGIKVCVDLCVEPQYYDIALIGVPYGWRSYSTRGYSDRIQELEIEYEMACERAQTKDINFYVYAGGKTDVRKLCIERGWAWLPAWTV